MAGLRDLEEAPGISQELAQRIYAYFHQGQRSENVS
jgi:hypothetical protein